MKGLSTLLKLTLSLTFLGLLSVCAMAQNKPSEQKTGSVLLFPYYTSNQVLGADTIMSISNTSTAAVEVHIFFIEGSSCWQADTVAFLTPNATLTLKTSFDVPEETGYLIAVALDQNGNVIANGGLSGSAFVKAPAGYFGAASGAVQGNYGATAFNALRPIAPANGQIELNFGVDLDAMPTSFSVAVQSPADVPGQTIVLAGMNGNISEGNLTGGAHIGTGQAFSESEVFRSFSSFIRGGCQGIGTISTTNPRLSLVGGQGLAGLITPGTIGLLKFNTAGGAGLLITPQNSKGWSGIRGLTCQRTSNVTMTIPSF